MNKEFLSTKQKFIGSLLEKYSFWYGIVSHALQTWTDQVVESRFSIINGDFKPTTLCAYENLTILPLVFDYLDTTISLKLNLRSEPFKTKLKVLSESLGKDLVSQLTISLYDKTSKIRNKLLHQKGSISECKQKFVITNGDFSISLIALEQINRLISTLTRHLKDEKQLSLYEKSLIWSSHNLSFPGEKEPAILEAAKSEKVIDLCISRQRYKIDMRPKKFSCFEELKDHLINRFKNENGELIANTLFLFHYDDLEYSMPAEYAYINRDFTANDIGIWSA